MMKLMKRHANQEYSRNKSNYMKQFVLDVVFYFIFIFVIVFKKADKMERIQNAGYQVMKTMYLINLYQVLVGYCILYLKSNQDIIRSISRLDNLYLVSQF